jgi:exodeoxyribonuclease-3
VVGECDADLVVFQEATRPERLARIAAIAGMKQFGSRSGESLAFMSRVPVAHHAWHKPWPSRHAFLEIVPVGDAFRVFGVHLSAVHAAWTESRRVVELRALLSSIRKHQHGFNLLTGDFNTLAPGERLDVAALPQRLRALVWLSGGKIRFRTIQHVLDAGYVDGFRLLHPGDPGLTFPTSNSQVRLDFAFVPRGHTSRLTSCDVVTVPDTRQASDHFPLLTQLSVDR